VSVRIGIAFALAVTAALSGPARLDAQGRGGPAAPSNARAAAPVDLTGYWVAFVSEDWRVRMMTPPKGDFRGLPLTPEALKVANAWTPGADRGADDQCKPYGAAAILRVPGRLHVTWQDDNTLRLDTDAGMQTRLFRFAQPAAAAVPRTWQGESAARWEGAAPSGSLTVVTTNIKPGYLRRNGVPYSENAKVTDYFDVAPAPDGGQVLVVTTVVDDPRYLRRPLIVSTHFKKEADGSRWDPTPCTTAW
jgi:hypothetical protein